MDDDEIRARFAALRLAVAYAIKVASRHPAGINHSVAELRELEALVPEAASPALRDELQGIIAALNRLPRHGGEEAGRHPQAVHHPQVHAEPSDLPKDLLR